MSITRTIGGNRLGSGSKMKVAMHGYDRSTFNLSKVFRSTMACGTLVPCYTNIGLNGDTFDIDINALVRTLPTNAPLFGTMKMQIDGFVIPLRLYNGQLHNNPLNVGMKMQEIPFQKLTIYHSTTTDKYRNPRTCQINPSSLLAYLGLRGIGQLGAQSDNNLVWKEINATPILAYYDIFKNYYANRQEENFYWIGAKSEQTDTVINFIAGTYGNSDWGHTWKSTTGKNLTINGNDTWYYTIYGTALNIESIALQIPALGSTAKSLEELKESGNIEILYQSSTKIQFKFTVQQWGNNNTVTVTTNGTGSEDKIELKECPLEILDKVRECCLGATPAGKETSETTHYYSSHIVTFFGRDDITINGLSKLPYFSNLDKAAIPNNSIYSQYGLCVKTYQNDMYNNWLNKEIIDGENGISAVTTIDTTDGLNLDALNLAQKVYNMLNRIAISGGTYQDWQEVQYGEKVIRLAETPIYIGGVSYEIGFEEVVSTTDTGEQNETMLGSLAGKGTIIDKAENGHIIAHIEEPSLIMFIASITPRIDYSEGNKWYLTELLNYGDLHVPALDTIGYQNLKAEQMAWWTHTSTVEQGQDRDGDSPSVGKLPAWINYQTDVNEVYGDFADKLDYLVLQRNYEASRPTPAGIKVTSYIDPELFNTAFANADLYAQNFWVQIAFDIKARRKMSAKIIPNL